MEKERCGKNFKKVMAAKQGRDRHPYFQGRCCDLGRSIRCDLILRKMSTTSFGQKQTSLT